MDPKTLRNDASKWIERALKYREVADKLDNRAQLALRLADELDGEEIEDFAKPLQNESTGPSKNGVRLKPRQGSWTSSILDIVAKQEEGISYNDLKARLLETPLREKLLQSDKGFYGALLKLELAGQVQRRGGHAYSVAVFERMKAEIAKGVRRGFPGPDTSPQHSPIGDAIKAYFARLPVGTRATSRMIQTHLKQYDPEVRDLLNRNPTHIYNVLARLVKQGVLMRNDVLKFYILVSPAASAGNASGPPSKGGPVRSEGSHPSLNSSTPLNEKLL